MKKILPILIIALIFSNVLFVQIGKALEITEYEKEILIEKGWIRYLSVKVKNVQPDYLPGVGVSIDGEKSSWFEVQTEDTDMSPNESASFIIKLYIPSNEEKGTYSFTLSAVSGTVSTQESFSINLFTSRSEMMVQQIQTLRDNIDSLKEEADNAERINKNVEDVRILLSEAETLLNTARLDVQSGLYEDATEKLRDAEISINKAEFELSVAPIINVITGMTLSLEWVLIIVLITVIVLMSLFFLFTRKRVFRKVPGLKIKKMIVEEKDRGKIRDEIANLREAESLLEEEYKEGLISKGSYEELKAKYEEKILKLETK